MGVVAKQPGGGIQRGRRGIVLGLGVLVVGLMLLGGISGLGGPHDARIGLARTLWLVIAAGWAPGVYLLASVGLGRVFWRLIRGSSQPLALQAGLGLSLMLSLSHGLGALGLLAGGLGRALSAALLGAGLAVLLVQMAHRTWQTAKEEASGREAGGRLARWWWLVALPAGSLLLVAACSPPGALWASEGHGYDALSYHLPLPQEWLALGQVRPLEHNVYSFLPSYVEAAFYHLAVIRGEPLSESPHSTAWGLLAGDGEGVIACHLLSAGIAVFSAWMLAAAAAVVLERAGVEERVRRGVGAVTAALVLGTAWVIVTGSLAYNDLAVVGLAACAVIAAGDERLAPWVRGALSAVLVGAACGAKPTALFLAGPVVGMVLVASLPPRRWPAALAVGAVVGLAMLAPWLVRNWVYSGNPIFPMATEVFGNAHWSEEQAARYAAAHRFEGSWGERLRLLVLPDPADPMGRVHRGMMHPQWFLFFPLALAGAVAALVSRRSRWMALVLIGGFALQLGAWLVMTHIQSRFLLPLAVSGGLLFALGLAELARWWRRALLVAALAALVQLAGALGVFVQQNGGQPNQYLVFGPGLFSGELFRHRAADAGAEADPEPFEHVWPQLYVNFSMAPTARVYLLGEARPLYFTVPVLYNTTWDRWPLGEAMRDAPGEPQAWLAALRERGITHVLVNYGEIARLAGSGKGWADPLITPGAVSQIFEAHARRIRSWPEAGARWPEAREVLYELRGAVRN